ncbi:MAG: ABC transporter substrate-binding protein [Oscillospiraceae bacterium]|nr:ABC transporter substrate-binding protein [Oscillospiraceae bacterium]
MYEKTYGTKLEVKPYTKNEEDFHNTGTYYAQLAEDLLGGNGPDLVILSTEFGADIYKMMRDGVFLDLNQFILDDVNFDLSLYQDSVMDAGMFMGERYLIPLMYSVPLMITNTDMMYRYGVTREDFSTYDRFLDTTENLLTTFDMRLDCWVGLVNYLNFSGCFSETIGFDDGTIYMEQPSFRKLVDLSKRSYTHSDKFGYVQDYAIFSEVAAYEYSFSTTLEPLFMVEKYLTEADAAHVEMVMIPLPNDYGCNTARVSCYCLIPATSSNIEGAWNLIKMLLSEEIQSSLNNNYSVGVMTGYIESTIRNVNSNHYGVSEKDITELISIYLSCDNAVLADNPLGMLVLGEIGDYIHNPMPFEYFSHEKNISKTNLELWLQQ